MERGDGVRATQAESRIVASSLRAGGRVLAWAGRTIRADEGRRFARSRQTRLLSVPGRADPEGPLSQVSWGEPKVRGNLRLDSREAVLRGGDQGPAVTLDQPDESLILQAIRYDGLEMPPVGKAAPETRSKS